VSIDRFEDDCPGYRPVLVDIKTGKPYADDSREMKAVNLVWSETTFGQRRAWHAFTCQNVRSLSVIAIVKPLTERIEAAIARAILPAANENN
jgi:hypothetical protein